ncbi:hypothetical protein FSP39_014005, partial [Pinctada imbricata]
IVLQTQGYCTPCNFDYCRNPAYYNTKVDFQNQIEDVVRGQSYQYYEDSKNCVVSIKARPQHQIEILLEQLDLDGNAVLDNRGYPVECHDYLKIFNGPRVDNARLLPGIPPSGLCGTVTTGSDLPNLRSFKTTQNELTVQFVSDNMRESKAGFQLRIKQYLYTNPGNLYPSGGNPGGWNDGSFNEFQTNWDEQIVIPGGELPGGGNDYDKDPNGVDCYSCAFCQVEPFDVESSGVGTEKSCHVCSKEWDDEYQIARRECYSEVQYNSLLVGISTGSTVESSYTGCKKFVNQYQRTVNYCFCKENLCNGGRTTIYNTHILALCAMVIYLYKRLR